MVDGAGVSRRSVLKGGAALAVGGALAPLLAACGGSSGARKSGSGSGLLRVAAAGAATGITVNPLKVSPGAGALVLAQLYDPLVQLRGGKFVMRLAESIEPNADAMVWTIRVRDGVTFHDGRKVSADDVVFSLQSLYDPKKNALAGASAPWVNLAGIAKVDSRTVRVPLTRPRGDFVESMLSALSTVFPADTTDFSKGIGSGPFRLSKAGATAVTVVRNPDYWDGAPSIETLELSQINDPTTRLNAVASGQLDYAVGVSAVGAHSHASDKSVAIHQGGPENSNALLFVMNQSKAPFTDPDVRKALRLAVDRQQLVDNILFGLGSVGNDLVGKGLPGYAELPQRSHDPDQAKSLLAGAGVDTVSLRAADYVPGLVDAANTFAQQAAKAGLKVTVDTADAATSFSDIPALQALPFQTFYDINRPAAVHLALMTAKGAPFNFTGLGQAYEDALSAAIATVDASARAAKFHDLQQQLYDTGGDIVWGFAEQLDASRTGVSGIEWSQSTPLFGQVTVS